MKRKQHWPEETHWRQGYCLKGALWIWESRGSLGSWRGFRSMKRQSSCNPLIKNETNHSKTYFGLCQQF
jgi:hypothetical protein